MNDIEISKLFDPLWDDMFDDNIFDGNKRLLAHYTSIEVFESILKNNEVWLSNPLFMNDITEIRLGVNGALTLITGSQAIKDSCGTNKRVEIFMEDFHYYYNQFANDQVMDTYIFCLSEHKKENSDGSLSMWRGYGNNGNGVSIVFDTTKLTEMNESPLIIAKVQYVTDEQLANMLNQVILKVAAIIHKENIPDDKLYHAAFHLFDRIKFISLFIKHKGFQEEVEWRMVYMKSRDPELKLESKFSYWVGPRGIEPKLKLKIEPFAGVISDGTSLSSIVDHIILGPSVSSPLAKETILRMLDRLGKPEMKDKICTSSIPFRSR